MSTREPDLPQAVDADGKPVAAAPAPVTAEQSELLELDRGPWNVTERAWFDLDFASKPVQVALALVVAAVAMSLGAWLILSFMTATPVTQ